MKNKKIIYITAVICIVGFWGTAVIFSCSPRSRRERMRFITKETNEPEVSVPVSRGGKNEGREGAGSCKGTNGYMKDITNHLEDGSWLAGFDMKNKREACLTAEGTDSNCRRSIAEKAAGNKMGSSAAAEQSLWRELCKSLLRELEKERKYWTWPVTGVEEYTVVEPCVDREALLDDNEFLDYADEDIIVFHGYFGLFVYSLKEQRMLASLSLATYEHQIEQTGNCYGEIFVAEDGAVVYICPYVKNKPKNYMYVYEWGGPKLIKTAYAIDGIEMFDRYIVKGRTGIELERNGMKQVCYLKGEDKTIGSLKYIAGDREIRIFKES